MEEIAKTYNFVTGISDHTIIFFSRKLSKQAFSKAQSHPIVKTIPKHLQHSLEVALQGLEWDDIHSCDDVDTGCNILLAKIGKVMESFTRGGNQRKGRKMTLPWVDKKCRDQMKTRDLLLKKALKSGLTTDRQLFTHARNKVTHFLRKAKAKFYISIIKSAREMEKKFGNT